MVWIEKSLRQCTHLDHKDIRTRRRIPSTPPVHKKNYENVENNNVSAELFQNNYH